MTPKIILPASFKDKSGLYLPSSFAPSFVDVSMPSELRGPVELIGAGRLPTFFDQLYVYATEHELGLDPTPAADVVAISEAIPFWPSMRFLSKLQRDLWHARVDEEAQIALLNQRYGGSNYAARAEAWMRQRAQRVIFSEQQIFALQRLIILNARDGPLDASHTEEEYIALLMALAAVPGSVLGPEAVPDEGPPSVEDERWMRLFVGHGGFIGRGALRNELGRAFRLYGQIASSDGARAHHDYCPLDEWLVDEYGVTFAELQAFGFALHAGSKMQSDEELPSLIDETYFATTDVAAKARAGLDALSAPREWYVDAFFKTHSDPRRATFQITPFLQRPALRQPDGKIMPIAPRALEAWMSATGNYYRLFDLARAKGSSTRKQFTRFNGMLVETYVHETVQRAYPRLLSKGSLWLPGAVHRDRTYPGKGGERRTPDVAIDLTPDLILIEVTSSRLTERSVVDAEPEAVRKDIEKVLIDKIEQLGDAIRDFQRAVVGLPNLEIDQVDRIWPIVVSAEGLFQTPTLWAYLKPVIEVSQAQPKVQPLTLLDLEDLEELMGLVLGGASALEVLREKTSEAWRELEFASWFRSVGVRQYPDTSPLARAQFDAAVDAVTRTLLGDGAIENVGRLTDSDG